MGSKEYVISLKREGEFRMADNNHTQKIQPGFCAGNFSLLWLQMGSLTSLSKGLFNANFLQLLALIFCLDLIKINLVLCSAIALYGVQLSQQLKAKYSEASLLMYLQVWRGLASGSVRTYSVSLSKCFDLDSF